MNAAPEEQHQHKCSSAPGARGAAADLQNGRLIRQSETATRGCNSQQVFGLSPNAQNRGDGINWPMFIQQSPGPKNRLEEENRGAPQATPQNQQPFQELSGLILRAGSCRSGRGVPPGCDFAVGAAAASAAARNKRRPLLQPSSAQSGPRGASDLRCRAAPPMIQARLRHAPTLPLRFRSFPRNVPAGQDRRQLVPRRRKSARAPASRSALPGANVSWEPPVRRQPRRRIAVVSGSALINQPC